jgi:hypothetical protein
LFEQDFIKRQINAIADALSVAIFGKKKLSRIMENEDEEKEGMGSDFDSDILKTVLEHNFKTGNYKEARELIFDAVNKNSSKINLILALTFYDKVLKLSDEELKKHGFSKDEVEKDIEKLKDIYNED